MNNKFTTNLYNFIIGQTHHQLKPFVKKSTKYISLNALQCNSVCLSCMNNLQMLQLHIWLTSILSLQFYHTYLNIEKKYWFSTIMKYGKYATLMCIFKLLLKQYIVKILSKAKHTCKCLLFGSTNKILVFQQMIVIQIKRMTAKALITFITQNIKKCPCLPKKKIRCSRSFLL